MAMGRKLTRESRIEIPIAKKRRVNSNFTFNLLHIFRQAYSPITMKRFDLKLKKSQSAKITVYF